MNAVNGNGRSRVNWNTFFAGCGLILTVGGMAVYAIVAPWKTQIEGLATVQIREREITDLKIKVVTEVENARFIEIETQFRSSDQARNVQFAEQQREFARVYEKVFGQRYPSDIHYFPNISK